MAAEAAAQHIDASNPFVWRRQDSTFAVVHCWPVKYNDAFRQTFTCSETNPDTEAFQPEAAAEFAQAMRRLFGPDADKIPLLYAKKTTHSSSQVSTEDIRAPQVGRRHAALLGYMPTRR